MQEPNYIQIFAVYYYPFIFMMGLALGSFVNMLLYRIKHKQNLMGRSFCDFTNEPLTYKDLIPVISYLVYRGRCRKCKEKLPVAYPVIEILSGIMATLTFAYAASIATTLPALFLLGFGYIFIFTALYFFGLYDLYYWELDNKSLIYALLGTVVAVFAIGLTQNEMNIGDSLAGGIILTVAFVMIRVIFKGAGTTKEDIILFAITGLAVGFNRLIWFMPLFLFSATIVGLFVVLKNKRLHNTKVQLAPFVGFAAIVSIIFSSFFTNIVS